MRSLSNEDADCRRLIRYARWLVLAASTGGCMHAAPCPSASSVHEVAAAPLQVRDAADPRVERRATAHHDVRLLCGPVPFAIGEVDDDKTRLRRVGIQALRDAIATIRTGTRTGDVGAAIQGTLEAGGLAAVRDYGGYGIDERPIKDPELLCFGARGRGPLLQEDMLLHVHVIAAGAG